MKNLVFLGAPGAGKGTQAKRISEKYDIPHISTGDILRANIKEGTELGKLAKSYIDKGALVPDEVIIKVMQARLAEDDCKKGYLLDGFPRTIEQAKALDNITTVTLAVNIVVDDDAVVRRIAGRRMCVWTSATNAAQNSTRETTIKKKPSNPDSTSMQSRRHRSSSIIPTKECSLTLTVYRTSQK